MANRKRKSVGGQSLSEVESALVEVALQAESAGNSEVSIGFEELVQRVASRLSRWVLKRDGARVVSEMKDDGTGSARTAIENFFANQSEVSKVVAKKSGNKVIVMATSSRQSAERIPSKNEVRPSDITVTEQPIEWGNRSTTDLFDTTVQPEKAKG